MKIKKGTILEVDDARKGKYVGKAIDDFDTDRLNFEYKLGFLLCGGSGDF
jgi:hypothetical protein